MSAEIWADIVGFEGIYKISTNGNIMKKGKLMRQRLDRHGYYRIVVRRNKRQLNWSAHRLVAIAFIPNPGNKPQVNHKNRIRTDNTVDNLEWCTGKENIIHSFKNGRKPTIHAGEAASWHKLKAIDIPIIRQLIRDKITFKKIGEMYSVSLHTIYSIKTGKNWKHIK